MDDRSTECSSYIAKVYGKLSQPQKAAELLTDTLKIAWTMDDLYYKASALRAIAEASVKLNQPQKGAEFIVQAFQIAETINYSDFKADALNAIAATYAKLGHWRQARQAADKIPNEDKKLESFAKILTIWAEKHNPALVEEEGETINK